MLTLSDRSIDDARLNHLMNTAPPNVSNNYYSTLSKLKQNSLNQFWRFKSFLLLEDIDNAFVKRDEELDNNQMRAYEGLNRVTMSGLLNSIDGVASSEERILFMTTLRNLYIYYFKKCEKKFQITEIM
jgi:chaperone BCS1